MVTNEDWADLYIDQSFRDAADEDYVVARASYRLGLTYAYLWSSLHAIEKYLKAILLYNRCKTIGLNHDVGDAFKKVQKIADIPFNFPAEVKKFIIYVNEEGNNRYREFPMRLREDSLLMLDRTVWHLRRYCFPFPKYGTAQYLQELERVRDESISSRISFKIPGGRLEKILEEKTRARSELIWKNFFYGARPRRIIKKFPYRMQAVQPVYLSHPEVYWILKDLVQFDKSVRAHFESMRKETNTKGRKKRKTR